MDMEIEENEMYLPQHENKISQLIIIGNGFDRACNLKSSYNNWYRSRFNGNGYFWKFLNRFLEGPPNDFNTSSQLGALSLIFDEIVNKDFIVPSSNQKITVWDIILLKNKKTTGEWKSIEEIIERVLKKNDEGIGDIFYISASERDALSQYIYSDITGISKLLQFDGINPIIKLLAERYRESDFLFNILNSTSSTNNGSNRNRNYSSSRHEQRIYKLMLAELRLFELEFTKYLRAEAKNDITYSGKANKLLAELCSHEINSAAIMSFNYTEPFGNINNVFNVHGTLCDENIIFGIDKQEMKEEIRSDSENDNSDEILNFTKTYRKLFSSPTGVLADCTNVKTIKFYGHSLGRMDYSYFLAIFDALNLYNNTKVKIEFYYTDHRNNLINTQNKQFHAVTNLLDKYGQSFANQHQGKNLMHKLMLEGRLSIKNTDECFSTTGLGK